MLLTDISIELVLSVLLERFIFSLGTKEIYWKMSGLATPSVKGTMQDRPVMPLKLTLAKK